MASRFTNPHLRPISSKRVSRNEVFSYDENDDNSGDERCENHDRLELLNKLKENLQASLEFQVSALEDRSEHRKKRRKITETEKGEKGSTDEPLPALRLVSTLEAIPISLQPPAPKPPKCYRDPDIEDHDKASQQRRKRAQLAAVETDWLRRESTVPHLPFPTSTSKLSYVTVETALGLEKAPTLAILERVQPLRRTRPPVPRSQLAHHPYMEGAEPQSLATGSGQTAETSGRLEGNRIRKYHIEPSKG
ncbi:hypothetical protein AAF712_006830 [Marasmius tenuissimus]|uniref:Uncharacterized protein n=1 Tax=Marasmius tenuissimus TaxID=585030 RepID=A0ABR2ZY02_9AGAR